MLPKIASALARVLDPIKPIARPGQSISLNRSSEGGEGGQGPLGYEAPHKEEGETGREAEAGSDPLPEPLGPNGSPLESAGKRNASLPLQPGLTQVILELNASRTERTSGAAVQTYETGAKEQKKNARLPKGSMLDKKVG